MQPDEQLEHVLTARDAQVAGFGIVAIEGGRGDAKKERFNVSEMQIRTN